MPPSPLVPRLAGRCETLQDLIIERFVASTYSKKRNRKECAKTKKHLIDI